MTRFLYLGVLAVFLAGCEPAGPKLPALVKVSGTVNLDGKPMDGGEIRFERDGVPPKTIPVASGSFSGEAFSGKNKVSVVYEKEGPPHPMDPTKKLKVNVVDSKFSGSQTTLSQEVGDKGASDLKFDVTSAR